MERWAGKVAVVTGASSGIGAAIAEKLVSSGMIVVGLARRVELVENLAKTLQDKPGKLHGIKTDITNEEDIISAFEWISSNLGPVQVLINNAGVIKTTNLLDGDTNAWKMIMDTNVMGLAITTRESIKMMRAKELEGHVVNINSITGNRVMQSTQMYGASKHAATCLAELLRSEIREAGLKIKMTSVHPGVVDTPMILSGDEKTTALVATLPKLSPNAIADAVMYSLSTPPDVQVTQMTVQPIGEIY